MWLLSCKGRGHCDLMGCSSFFIGGTAGTEAIELEEIEVKAEGEPKGR